MKHEALNLLQELGSETAEWIFSVGTERGVAREQPITIEGPALAEIFVMLDGLLAVRARGTEGAFLTLLGPGELVGEISFLEHSPVLPAWRAKTRECSASPVLTSSNALETIRRSRPTFIEGLPEFCHAGYASARRHWRRTQETLMALTPSALGETWLR